MAESPQYRLVSDELYEAVYGNPQDTPVYRQWLDHMGSFEGKVPTFWDEEEVIRHVRKMLSAASRLFVFLPEPVRQLKETHEAAEKGGVEYIRYATSAKLKIVSDVIDSRQPIANHEKLLRNLQRGIDKRIAGIARIASINGIDLEDFLARIDAARQEIETMTFREEELTSAITIFRSMEELEAMTFRKERLTTTTAKLQLLADLRNL